MGFISNCSTKNNFKHIIHKNKNIINIISNQTKINYNVVKNIIHKNINNDQDIYNNLHNVFVSINKSSNKYDDSSYLTSRAQKASSIIQKLCSDISFNNHTLLDIGCGDGSITKETKNLMNFNKAICVDVDNWLGNYSSKSNLEFIITDGKSINLPDNSIDVILLFHVLHHIKDLDLMISEISRILKKNGIIVLKEHNCFNEMVRDTVDIYHALFEVVMKKEQNNKFYDEYYAKYFTNDEICQMFDKHKIIPIKYDYVGGSIFNYYLVLRKK
jgi:ubiquinone/menaquinone biosynthesis C-methylase UbiE